LSSGYNRGGGWTIGGDPVEIVANDVVIGEDANGWSKGNNHGYWKADHRRNLKDLVVWFL